MFFRLAAPSLPVSGRFSIALSVGVGLGLGLLLVGCGGGNHNGQTVDAQGIVLSYPETVTGTVTEADLTPVGAGVTVGVTGVGEDTILRPPYYTNHPFPQTDANGRFVLKYDLQPPLIEESPYVADRCAVTPGVSYRNGSFDVYAAQSGNGLTHGPSQQLLNAAILGDAIKAKYHANVVIVVTDRTDACTLPQSSWGNF